MLDKAIHRSAVEGRLFGLVGVVLITGHLLTPAAQSHWLYRIGIVRQQLWGEAVYHWGVRSAMERLAVDVGGMGIRPEVVIKRDVLLKDDHQMMDRRSGGGFRARGRGSVRTSGDETEHCDNDAETLQHHAAEGYRL
jgi:hypothetical protein